MKNNTKIRLHLSKQLFESLTKQVIAEAKGKKNFGAGMTEVKAKKEKKKEEPLKEMETITAEAPKVEESMLDAIQALFNTPAAGILIPILTLVAGGVGIKAAVKKTAEEEIAKNPEKYKGKSVDDVAKEIGSALQSHMQKSAGGSGKGGLLGK